MPYEGKTNLAKGKNLQQTVCTLVDNGQSSTHLADHHVQQEKPRMWKIRTLEAPMLKWTSDPNSTIDEENRKVNEVKLMKIPSCSADTTSQGMTNCQT